MVITLCSSCRFYDEVLWWKDVLTKLGHNILCFDMEDESIPKEVLQDEHDAKIKMSDAILVVNTNNYIGESVTHEIQVARDNRVDVFTTVMSEESKYLLKIPVEDKYMYLTIPDSNYYIFHESNYPEYEMIDDLIMKISLAAKPGIPNVNGVSYTFESLIKALQTNRMHELYDRNSLRVEFALSSTKAHNIHQVLSIDLNNTIGRFIAISSKYLYIILDKDKKEEYSKLDLAAFMRYNTETVKVGVPVEISTIFTWDIWYKNSLPKEYWDKLEEV